MTGPRFTKAAVLAYLRDDHAPPVEAQYLDQLFAAADDLREAVGIEPNHQLRIPSARKLTALVEMWTRLIDESAGDVCEHLQAVELQPTAIIPDEHKQMCGRCWSEHPWEPIPNKMTIAEARKLSCDCCGSRFTRRWNDHDRDEGIWDQTRQFWHFIAPLKLCGPCHRLINYGGDDLPPDLRKGVADALEVLLDRRTEETEK